MMVKIRLFKLAEIIGAQLYGDGNIIITNVASINTAQIGHVTFLKDYRFRNALLSCAASAVILSKENLPFCHTAAALIVNDPDLAYIKTVRLWDHTRNKLNNFNITSGSIIAPDVILGSRISIGSNTIIESGVIINNDVNIGSSTFIGRNTQIGIGTYLCSNVTVYPDTEIGEYCVIQSGSIIGSDGFGYIKRNGVWIKIPHLGKVKIGNHVEIGASTTIDRGTLDDTKILNGVIIDNQCQIAHNVIIGEHTAVAGGVIIAGSVIIGNHCMIGGASVINGHISICDKVIITGMSMVIKSIVIPGTYSSGIPVQPNAIWRKTAVLVMNIGKINKRIHMIEQKMKDHYRIYCKIIKIMYIFVLLGLTEFVLLMRFFLKQE